MPVAKPYLQDQTFEKIDFTEQPLPGGEYDNCTFLNCDLSGANLSGVHFSECEFRGCNLSLAKLAKTALRDVKFYDCKLQGLHFYTCSELMFTVAFQNCNLEYCSFFKLTLKSTTFRNCSLREADFSQSNLSSSSFDNCDLSLATFDQTNLEKCDFRTAVNFTINPENNRLKKAKLSADGLTGLVQHLGIVVE